MACLRRNPGLASGSLTTTAAVATIRISGRVRNGPVSFASILRINIGPKVGCDCRDARPSSWISVFGKPCFRSGLLRDMQSLLVSMLLIDVSSFSTAKMAAESIQAAI